VSAHELLGCSQPLVPACFHAARELTDPTVRRSFRTGFILSCLVSSSEFLRRSSFFAPFGAKRPARVSSLFAASPGAATCAEALPLPLRSAPGFLSLATVCSASGFAGLSHPAATSRVSSSRGFSRSVAVPAHRRPLPPCRLASVHSPASRLPWADTSASRLCSADRSVLEGRWLAFLRLAPLFGFLLLQAPAHPRGPVPRVLRS